jgi:hypothetical protein
LTKGTDSQWKVLEESGVLAKLSKLLFDTKYKELMQQVLAIPELELKKLDEREEIEDINEDVNEKENELL